MLLWLHAMLGGLHSKSYLHPFSIIMPFLFYQQLLFLNLPQLPWPRLPTADLPTIFLRGFLVQLSFFRGLVLSQRV